MHLTENGRNGKRTEISEETTTNLFLFTHIKIPTPKLKAILNKNVAFLPKNNEALISNGRLDKCNESTVSEAERSTTRQYIHLN